MDFKNGVISQEDQPMQLKKNRTNSKPNKANAAQTGECIGIDITPQAIHSVLLSARSLNQIRLEKYAVTPLPERIINDSNIEDHDQLVSYLQQAMRQLGSNCKNITVSLPQNLASVQVLQYNARHTELSLDEFVEFEVSQSSSLEDSSYDYFVLEEHSADVKDVLLVSCNRDEVAVRVDAFTAANITPKQMDVYVLALINAVSQWINSTQPDLADQNVAVFHIGHHSTSALILRHGRLLYKQEINLGYEQLTHIVRRNYQLGEEEARAMVYAADKPADFIAKAGSVFQDQLSQEVQRFLQFYYTTSSQDQGSDVQHILLCGYPNNQACGIAERIARQVNLPTQQINPISAAQTASRLDSAQLEAACRVLTIAFGLAVRGL